MIHGCVLVVCLVGVVLRCAPFVLVCAWVFGILGELDVAHVCVVVVPGFAPNAQHLAQRLQTGLNSYGYNSAIIRLNSTCNFHLTIWLPQPCPKLPNNAGANVTFHVVFAMC